MRNKIKICNGCNKGNPIANNHFQLCHLCNRNRLKEGKQAKQATTPCRARKVLRKRYKPTGELTVFLKIWKERPHYCINCKAYLSDPPKAHYFSHNRAKSLDSKNRLNPEGISLLCFSCHFAKDHGTMAQYKERTR